MKGALVFAALAVSALWLFSHAVPERFGACHQVPLNIGKTASVRECQAYDTNAFLVPLAVIALLALIMGGEGDIEIDIPVLGKFKRTRAAKLAANVLKEETNTLDQRGQAFLQTVELEAPQGNVDESATGDSRRE